MLESTTRKLIDIKASTFRALSYKARQKGVSLKRYIEDLLDESSMSDEFPSPEGVTDQRILSLIGMAKPTVPSEGITDEKLHYILSK